MNELLKAVAGRIKEKTAIARIFRTNAQMRHGLPSHEDDLEIPTVQVEHSHTHEHKGLEKEREVVEGLKESVKEETKAVEGLTEAVREEKTKAVVAMLQAPPNKETTEGSLSEAVPLADPDIQKKSGSNIPDWLANGLLAATLLGGGASVPLGIDYFFGTPSVESEKDGSLLQYLEDRGEHLPEGFEK